MSGEDSTDVTGEVPVQASQASLLPDSLNAGYLVGGMLIFAALWMAYGRRD